MKNDSDTEFYRLLLLNDPNLLERFILRNGKIKPICPVRFVSSENLKEEEGSSYGCIGNY